MATFEKLLEDSGFTIPPLPPVKGNYLPYQWSNGCLHVSGQLSITADGRSVTGAVGGDRSVEEGYHGAELACLNLLAQIIKAVGSLDNIRRFVMLNGYVQSVPGFTDSPAVINGASDTLQKIFGDKGRHARAAVGVSGLPANASVEIQAVLEVK